MTLQAIGASATILTLSLFVLFLVRRLGGDRQTLPVTTDWLNELSIERYRPMLRILESDDFQYLRRQKGYTPAMGRRLRNERADAFVGYLQMLQADFKRVAAALELMVAQSSHDRPELASALVHRRVTVACGMLEVRVRIALFRVGFHGVDAAALIRMFDGLHCELREVMPACSPAMA